MVMLTAIAATVVGAIALYFVFSWWHSTRDHEGNHWICQQDGYPDIHVPKEGITKDEADEIADDLWNAIIATWATCNDLYAVNGIYSERFPIVTIGMGLDEISKDHPHVEWPMPRDKMRLRLQPMMRYYLAGETHNVYRYCLHGTQYATKPKNKDDAARAVAVQAWIKDTYA
jgi:hypothetical protein